MHKGSDKSLVSQIKRGCLLRTHFRERRKSEDETLDTRAFVYRHKMILIGMKRKTIVQKKKNLLADEKIPCEEEC